jgi:hypothetical protein
MTVPVFVLRVQVTHGGGFRSLDHERIGKVLEQVEEHMKGAGIDSPGYVTSPYGGTVARWAIEEVEADFFADKSDAEPT